MNPIEQINEVLRIGQEMSYLLARLAQLSDQRDQAAVKEVLAEWDVLWAPKSEDKK